MSSKELTTRRERAVGEVMTVLPDMNGAAKGVEDMYAVVSSSGSTYVVDLDVGACTCHDALYNISGDDECKHVKRARYATGDEAIPADVAMNVSPDEGIGAHVAGEVEVEEVEKPTP